MCPVYSPFEAEWEEISYGEGNVFREVATNPASETIIALMKHKDHENDGLKFAEFSPKTGLWRVEKSIPSLP